MPRTVLSLFQSRLAAAPAAPAVTDDQSSRTYAELDAEATGYAAELTGSGAGRETVVGIVADRSPRFVAMALGVLQAGAAFLPIDPSTPADRARRMCETAAVPVLFAQPRHAGYAADLAMRLPPGRAQVILPAAPRPVPVFGPARPHGDLASRDPAGLAYVIFTSGSTGVPKGAMVTDGGMANHIAAKTADLKLGPGDVVGLTAALSFDISVWQALTALTVGGTVAVASSENLSEPDHLLAWVSRHGVTVLEIVPSYLTVILELESAAKLRSAFSSLRFMIATGEALPARLVQRWHECCPGIPLMNAYGPTECSDDVTHHIVTAEDCQDGGWPPIGREIGNTRIHIVDPEGQIVPDGAEGELFVGGAGVGRGYLGDPVRTALSFIPDHLSGEPGVRLYRTGDRGRRGADGTLSYLGRRDRQVKVRGHRIELGDSEAQLLRVPQVASAACVAADGQLHAFVTLRPDAGGADAADGIRDVLSSFAPGYLIPQHLTILDRMPAGTSGKIDYRALETMARAQPAQQPRPAEPKAAVPDDGTMLDRACAVVAEILGNAQAGPADHFFEAGGDSLRAMALVSLARKRFDVEGISLRDFYLDPTPRGLAAAVQAARTAPPEQHLDLTPGALSSGQERLWFLEQFSRARDPLLIHLELTLRGRLDRRALQHALDALAIRHEPLRTVFSQEAGVPVATVWPQVGVPLRTGEPGDGQAPDGHKLSARTEQPPLMTARLTTIAADHHVLTLVMHHLVADGWSLAVLGNEIATYYQRWVDGVAEVPVPTTGFSHYINAERRWLDGPEAAECERYWTTGLAGAPYVIELPLSRPRPARLSSRTACVVRELTPRETSALRAVAQARKATPFMAVMAAFYALVREITGIDDVVIGIDSVNRSWPGSEELIGTFVNQLPVRLTRPGAGYSFGELLELARRRCLGAYEHEKLPFHKIVAAVNPPRRTGRFPLFQIKLTHQSAWRTGFSLPGLEVLPRLIPDPVMDPELMLDMSGESGALRLELLYLPELLDAETVTAWADAVAGLLRHGIADPDAVLAPGLEPGPSEGDITAGTGSVARGEGR
ncbi:MAG TPA: amino acid adenylation domain-containing protein [Streptosporangiaceae bacterium]|nr:amino acid adenylation domain-containing protein [Streptosporangiaceae bacterium]